MSLARPVASLCHDVPAMDPPVDIGRPIRRSSLAGAPTDYPISATPTKTKGHRPRLSGRRSFPVVTAIDVLVESYRPRLMTAPNLSRTYAGRSGFDPRASRQTSLSRMLFMTSGLDPRVAHPWDQHASRWAAAISINHDLCDCNDARSCVFVDLTR
jgi:hypothetical protein